MSRLKLLGFAAISWLPLVSLVGSAQASELFDAASDWHTTWSTSANFIANAPSSNATWGNATAAGVWSAGNLSYNFTNTQVLGQADGTTANGNYFLNYYQPTTGFETNGGTTKVATYNYTVPFQANPFLPGVTMHQQVGPTLANQINYAKGVYGSSTAAIPAANTTVGTGAYAPTSTYGSLTEVGTARTSQFDGAVAGFTTTSYNPTGGKYTDGGGSVQAAPTGVFYNYGASTSSSQLAALAYPASSTYDVLQMSTGFSGPTYIAWTAPQGGYISISVQAVDQLDQKASCGYGLDGDPGFYIIDPSKGNFEDPNGTLSNTPGLLVSAPNLSSPGAGSQVVPGDFENYGQTSSIGGTFSFSNPNQGTGSSGANGNTLQMQWSSDSRYTDYPIYVTTGETIYFVEDPGTGQYQSHANHSFGYGRDPIALSAEVKYLLVPEPSSVVLLGLGTLALAAVSRRRMRTIQGLRNRD